MRLLREGTAAWGISLSDRQVGQFERYRALLLTWNERVNLTAITDPDEMEVRHFLDSLSCTLATGDLNGRSLIDVGTGAGFPGLPLKILFPDLRLTLAESVTKKTRFLETAVEALGLEDVTVLDERAETLGRQPAHRERYDWAAARAVADMRVLAEYLLPLCRVGGKALAQKGESAAEETAVAASAIKTLGGGAAHIIPVRLPQHPMTHNLVTIDKERPTPDRYPRRPGMPSKRPLA